MPSAGYTANGANRHHSS